MGGYRLVRRLLRDCGQLGRPLAKEWPQDSRNGLWSGFSAGLMLAAGSTSPGTPRAVLLLRRQIHADMGHFKCGLIAGAASLLGFLHASPGRERTSWGLKAISEQKKRQEHTPVMNSCHLKPGIRICLFAPSFATSAIAFTSQKYANVSLAFASIRYIANSRGQELPPN